MLKIATKGTARLAPFIPYLPSNIYLRARIVESMLVREGVSVL